MSKKNKNSASSLPSDPFTFSTGRTWCLDGFHHEEPQGEGVEQHGRLPEASGLGHRGIGQLPGEVMPSIDRGSELPLGVQKEADCMPDLTEMLAPSVVNLDWLTPPEGPPDRLPQTPEAIPELEEAWGEHRTTGTRLAPENVDLNHARHRQNLEQPARVTITREEKLEIRDLVKKAARKSASGAPLDNVINIVKWAAGEEHPALDHLRDDDGLAGNVFIRAAAYPGCANGKWSKHVRKVASGARYVIASKKCRGCNRNQNGRCQVFAKRLVKRVPWKKAARYYGRKFAAVGHDLDMSMPKESLRHAFQTEHRRDPRPHDFPRHRKEVDRVTDQEAGEWLQDRKEKPRKVIDGSNKRAARRRRKALSRLATWHRNELLTDGEFRKLRGIKARPRDILRVAGKIIANRKSSARYRGRGLDAFGKGYSEASIRKALKKVARDREERQAEVDDSRKHRAIKQIMRMARRGLITRKQAKHVLSRSESMQADEMLKKASSYVVEEQHSEATKHAPKREASAYVGEGERALAREEASVSAGKARRKVKASHRKASRREVEGMLHQVRRQMNEGAAGHELDYLIETMYSPTVIKAASKNLRSLRSRHEGLAGHLYVDARAYATPTGVKGCEKGALRHRATPIRHVLAMDRCKRCVHNNAEGFCQKYAKRLSWDVPHDNPEAFQESMIRQANASDAETTASLFAPSGQEMLDEFSLSEANSPLDKFSFYEMPGDQPAEKLGEILWGGMHLIGEDGT